MAVRDFGAGGQVAHAWTGDSDWCCGERLAPGTSWGAIGFGGRRQHGRTMPAAEYDLIAVGGGTAGLVAASGAAYLGANAAIVEATALGGDCLWTGCVPSKAMLAAARAAEGMRRADRLGLPTCDGIPSFRSVMERVRAARARVAVHDDPERIRARGIDVHFGRAGFVGPGVLEVDGVGTLRTKRILLATGARPAVPKIPGLEQAGYITHESACGHDELSASILIVGAGAVGLEFAQIYSRLGASVTVLETLSEIQPADDPEAARALRQALEAEGVVFALGARPTAVETNGEHRVVTTADGRRFETHQIFVATGREPNTDGLGLKRAGVETDGAAVRVDHRLRSTARGVWAAGDVVGGPQFTHAAEAMAKVVVRNALLPLSSRVDLANVPRVVYTDPEVAQLGFSPEEAERRGGTTYRYDFADLDRAITDGATAGFTRVTADRKGRILGATIVGRGAGELIMPIVLARSRGLTLPDISGTIFPYPTMVEGVKRVADAYQRTRLEGPAGRLLRQIVSWLK